MWGYLVVPFKKTHHCLKYLYVKCDSFREGCNYVSFPKLSDLEAFFYSVSTDIPENRCAVEVTFGNCYTRK